MKPPDDNAWVEPDGVPSFEPIEKLDEAAVAEQAGALREALRYHDHRYYVLDDPAIADRVYDALFARLREIEELRPELRTADSPTRRIGGAVRDELDEVEHTAPMLSLDSGHEEEALREFDARVRRDLDAGDDEIVYLVEPKFDGLSVEVVYEDGRFSRAVTRGDGRRGEDVSENLRTIPSVPVRLIADGPAGRPPEMLAVRGEVFMPLEGFHAMNKRRVEEGDEPFANPRNAAAGAIRVLDSSITASRPLEAFFFDILSMSGDRSQTVPETHGEELDLLSGWGFKVGGERSRCAGVGEILEVFQRLEDERDELPYEIDGIVIKVDRLDQQERLGVRSRSPRYAYAHKFPPRAEVTTIEAITVQVGRTGILTPVALLAPTDVGGVTISRASLHNLDQIRDKDVREGDRVRVARAGDVIPYVVERVDERPEDERADPFGMPDRCPVCASEVVREGAYFVCTGGIGCRAQLLGAVQHYASRDALDIEGLGEETVRQLIDEELVHSSIAEIYELTVDDLVPLERFGEKKASNLVEAIEESKETTLGRFVYGLGIRHVGEHTASVLARELGDIQAIMDADEESLQEVREVGPEVARSIRDFFDQARNREVVEQLLEAGVTPGVEERREVFDGERFVVTGALGRWSRDEIRDLLEGLGARVTSSVSGRTDWVVVGEDPGAKADKAAELGVETLDEEGLVELLGQRGVAVDA